MINKNKYDDLTELKNRYSLQGYFNSLQNTKNAIVVMVDIDNFKLFNMESYSLGDLTLKSFSSRMDKSLSHFQNSIFGRWGGDEFIFISNGIDIKDVKNAFKKINTFSDIKITFAYIKCENNFDNLTDIIDVLYKKIIKLKSKKSTFLHQ